jgi:hypothetical protein
MGPWKIGIDHNPPNPPRNELGVVESRNRGLEGSFGALGDPSLVGGKQNRKLARDKKIQVVMVCWRWRRWSWRFIQRKKKFLLVWMEIDHRFRLSSNVNPSTMGAWTAKAKNSKYLSDAGWLEQVLGELIGLFLPDSSQLCKSVSEGVKL